MKSDAQRCDCCGKQYSFGMFYENGRWFCWHCLYVLQSLTEGEPDTLYHDGEEWTDEAPEM